MEKEKIKIVIVGGVAAGASAAAKARRVNERADIVLFERGPYVSFANCGLPYYVGGDIRERDSLFLQTPEGFRKRFNVDARVLHEACSIDRAGKKVRVRDLLSGDLFDESYDKLILAPGAGAFVPDLPGIPARNIFTVKTVPDSDAIRSYIQENGCRKAVIIGAGFIGLEAAEALKRRGLEVTVVEMLPQILPPFDADMASFVAQHLEAEGVRLLLGDGIRAFHGGERAAEAELSSGLRLPLDFAILSIGVRPELKLARQAGLEIGSSGGIRVNELQQTSDPDIYAAGDAVETVHLVTGAKTRIPLAGPANKQGRVAGANAAGDNLTFPGSLGTAIVETMGIAAAKTGLSENEARKAGLRHYVSYTHSLDHAGYYPGSSLMHVKLVAEEGTGRLLGAQIVGEAGVDKRIDVLATALSAGLKVTDLENLDLAYAPQFSSAKDPVNMAGFVASNVMRHAVETLTCEALREKIGRKEALQIVDVRTRGEYESGHLEASIWIPVDELRDRFHELDPSRDTLVYCKIGLRGYIAARILRQNGFGKVYNLTGGLLNCPGKLEKIPVKNETPKPSNGSVGVHALREIMTRGEAWVMDVREADEYRYEHIDGTRSFPLSRLRENIGQVPRDRDVYISCNTGVRSAQAVALLKDGGYSKIHLVDGGITAWKKSGFPVLKGGGPLPVIRQVQIIAGSLALAGGLFVPLRWVAVIAGLGLIYAGLSGTCGMALVLARMPWNKANPQKPGDASSPCSGC